MPRVVRTNGRCARPVKEDGSGRAGGPPTVSLRRNVSYAFVGNAVFAACQWGIILVLTRLGGPEVVGAYVLALAVCNPIFMFFGLELRTLLATDSRSVYGFGDYVRLRLTAVAAAAALSLAAATACGYRGLVLETIALLAGIKVLEWTTDVLYGLCQKHERLDRVGRSAVAHGLVNLSVVVAAMLVSGDLRVALAAYAVGHVAVLALYDVPRSLRLLKVEPGGSAVLAAWAVQRAAAGFLEPQSRKRLWKLVWLGAPLAATSMFVSLTTSTPRLFLMRWHTLHDVGILGSIASLILCGGVVARAVNAAFAPRLARYHHDRRHRPFRRLLLGACGLYLLGGLAATTLAAWQGPRLLSLFFRPEFAQYGPVLVLVVLAMTFSMLSGLVQTSLIALRRIPVLLPLTFSTWAWTAFWCWVLVPDRGVLGAAVALALARAPYLCGGLWLVWRTTRRLDSPPSTNDRSQEEPDRAGRAAATVPVPARKAG